MDAAQAIDLCKQRLQEVETLEDGLFRVVKRYGDQPYAVFYVDSTGNIQDRAEALLQYQDRILGRRYFEGASELRWNSYLLFLIDSASLNDAAIQRARAKLEGDRNYARKFVVTPEELVARISPRVLPLSRSRLSVDVVSQWERILCPVGLQGVFGERDIAGLVRDIATDAADSAVRQSPPKAR